MKNHLLTFFIAASISGCATVHNERTDDASLEQRIQSHTWDYREPVSKELTIEGETTYLPGGIMNLFGHVKENGQVRSILAPGTSGWRVANGNEKGQIRTILASGTWHVKNGYLYYTITKSNVANMIPNGFTSGDKIVRVTQNELTYISSADGNTVTEHRIR